MTQCARCGVDLPEQTRAAPKRLYCGQRCRNQAYRIRNRRLLEKLRKVRKGYCRKNLHRMVGDNVGFRADTETRFCRACKKDSWRERFDIGYRKARCVGYGCDRYTERGPMNREPYCCPAHRTQRLIAA